MRSRYADKFNHDEDAPDYDADVADESDPIRAGYAKLLAWIAAKAEIETDHRVLELGSGTGNLTVDLLPCQKLVCVDVSEEMTRIARDKLSERLGVARIDFVHDDVLAFFEQPNEPFDRIVSSYAIHHLTEDEKDLLFEHVRRRLAPGGRAVFGDLMFENDLTREALLTQWRSSGDDELVKTIEDELFWNLERAEEKLRSLGFATYRRRFSDLSWGLCCVPAPQTRGQHATDAVGSEPERPPVAPTRPTPK